VSDILRIIITRYPDLTGLHHVSSEPIDKYDSLQLLPEAFGVPIDITPDPSLEIERSLEARACGSSGLSGAGVACDDRADGRGRNSLRCMEVLLVNLERKRDSGPQNRFRWAVVVSRYITRNVSRTVTKIVLGYHHVFSAR
jgi:hypothetical protein